MSVHKRYYAAAAEEVASGNIDQALWIKAMVQAGNEPGARRLYLQLRAEELSSEGLKEQAKDLFQKGARAWQGKPKPKPQPVSQPQPNEAWVWVLGIAALIGLVIILAALTF